MYRYYVLWLCIHKLDMDRCVDLFFSTGTTGQNGGRLFNVFVKVEACESDTLSETLTFHSDISHTRIHEAAVILFARILVTYCSSSSLCNQIYHCRHLGVAFGVLARGSACNYNSPPLPKHHPPSSPHNCDAASNRTRAPWPINVAVTQHVSRRGV